MFDNIKWEEIINNVLYYVKRWNYLIVKFDISKTSYSIKYYYSKNGNNYVDLYNAIDDEKASQLFDNIMPELKKISEKFNSHKEKMFLTMKVQKTGNVKIMYSHIKDSNKLPFDAGYKYLKLSSENKNI